MRILLVHNYYQYWGGEDTYFESLKKLLKRKGHTVITYTKTSKDIKTIFDKIKVAIGMFWNQETKKELTYIIKKNKPDVAHFHNVYPIISPTAYWICKKYRVPIIQHIHNYRLICPSGTLYRAGEICKLCVGRKFPLYSIIYGCYHRSRLASLFFSLSFFFHQLINSFQLIDKFIFPSDFSKDYCQKYLSILKEKTAVVRYFASSDTKYKKTKKENYFLYVGRLTEEKGTLSLLDIISKLPHIKLVVVGNGPLRERILSYKSNSNIVYKNFLTRKKIYSIMKKALCVIIPSKWYETGPIVLIESLLNGTPVLVPHIGAFLEQIIEKKTGFFFKPFDLIDLKNKLLLLWKKKSNLIKMSEKARRLYRNNYTEEIHYKNIMNVYQSLI